MKKILVLALLLLSVLGLYLVFGKQAAPLVEGSKSWALAKPGPHKVVKTKLAMLDASRSIQANGDFEGSEQRAFDVFVWSAEPGTPINQPLVVYSHGFMSNGEGGEHIARHLASYGYTVASATYPLTNYGAPGGANPADVVNQPGDISFIIDSLLARNEQADDVLYQRIDPKRIAAVGMSLGGMTTEMVAYHPSNADTRIAVAVSIAGPSYMFSKRFFSGRNIPFMMIASPVDALISYQENAANILDKIDDAVLVTVDNASHTGFSGGAKWLRWLSNPDSLGCDTVMKTPDVDNQAEWYEQIGDSTIGVIASEAPSMCTMSPLPKTINPLRQLQITRLAVSSFLGCHFAIDEAERLEKCEFLSVHLASENAEVTVE